MRIMKVVVPKFKLQRKNALTISLLFVIAACENFAALIPASETLVGPLKFSDIGFISAFIWSIVVFAKSGFIFRRSKVTNILPALYFVVVIASSIVALQVFGQSLLDSLIRNRKILMAIILMYAIVRALNNKYINRRDFISILFFQAGVELLVDYIQYFTADFITFTYYDIGERYASTRLRAAYLLPLIVGFIAYDKFLKKEKFKEFYIMVFVAAVLLVALVCKHRMPTLIIIAVIGLSYLLWKKNFSKKFLIGIIVIAIGIPIVYNLPIVQDAMSTAVSEDANVNSLIIRNRAREYYLLQLEKSPIFGFGEPYATCTAASNAAGKIYGFIREDNGIFGYFYSHGIVGLIWLALFWISLIKHTVVLYRRNGDYCYILYIAYETINLYMGMHWYYDYPYAFMLMIALIEYDYFVYKNIKKIGVKQ